MIKDAQKLTCQCGCGYDTISAHTLHVLTDMAVEYEKRGGDVVILSGARCKKHNDTVGGSKTSNHLKGWAIDFTCTRDDRLDQNALDEFSSVWIFDSFEGEYGAEVLRYDTFVHIALRPDRPAVFRNMRRRKNI